MSVTADGGAREAVRQAWARRYGEAAVRQAQWRPGDPPLSPPPNDGTPRDRLRNPPSRPPRDPGSRVVPPDLPYYRRLPAAPIWVRAYQRIGFGITATSAQEFNALGTDATSRWNNLVEQQLAWESIDDSAVDARLAAAGYTTLGKTLPQLWADHVLNNPSDDVRRRPAREVQRSTLVRAVHSRRQLLERLAMFWNDHFNVTVTDFDAAPVYVHYNRNVIRGNAMGNFRTMLEAMARSTAMMYYLDNRTNTRAGPNENFARELLELHTMGAENYLGFVGNPDDVPPDPVDPDYPIGYSDIDVYETAASFTGWTVNSGTGGDGTFLYRSSNHDAGPKQVLGMFIPPEQPAMKDGRDIFDRLATHPRVARFICKKLIRHFVADTPPAALVESAANLFRSLWQDPQQIRKTMRHILTSSTARAAWGDKQRRPLEILVATLRAAGSDWTYRLDHPRSNELNGRLAAAGHSPYDWPAPNGYPDVASAWSGPNTYAMTWRMQGWLSGVLDGELPLLAILPISRASVPQWTAKALVEFWCRRLLGRLPAGSRLQALKAFMAQNGDPEAYVITDTNQGRSSDLKQHYNHDRLQNMVSMILMSPEFFSR